MQVNKQRKRHKHELQGKVSSNTIFMKDRMLQLVLGHIVAWFIEEQKEQTASVISAVVYKEV